MKITRTIGLAVVATAATAQMTLVSVGDAAAVPRRDLGGGYFEVGSFQDSTACESDRIAQQTNWNLGSSECYLLADGWYYKGRVGA